MIAMSLGLVSLTASAANAALPSGITQAQIVKSGTTQVVQPGDELPRGAELQLRVSYDLNAAGTTVDFKLGANATLGDISGLSANTEITDFETINGDTVRVIFKDPFERQAGVFVLTFTIDDDAGPGSTQIGWEINTEPVSVIVEIEDPNPPTPPVALETGYNKSVYTTSSTVSALNNYVRFKTVAGGYDVYEDVNPSILNQDITYTLRVTLGNGAGTHAIDIADQLPAGLRYVNAGTAAGDGDTVSTTVSGQQYDPAGLNPTSIAPTFAPTVGADNRSFSGAITLTGPAYVDITYTVRVTDIAAINTLMQNAWDTWNNTPGRTGTFTGNLTNTATFDGPGDEVTRDATVKVNGTVNGPCVTGCSGNGGFAKANNWGDQQREFKTDAQGNILLPASDIVYSFRANLGNFDGRNGNPLYTLDRNVVITDTLADQASWQTSRNDFISIAEGSIHGVTDLTELLGTCTAANITAASAGTFCVTGKTLRINVGMNALTNVLVEAKAQLDALDAPLVTGDNAAGLQEKGSSTVTDATSYRFRNVATITYSDTRGPASMGTNIFPVKLPLNSEETGLQDTDAFTKTGPGSARPNAEGVAEMPYEFKVNTAKTGAIENFHMVDYIDDRYFELSEPLEPPTVRVEGDYDGVSLAQEDFSLSLNADEDLVIVLSASGLAKVAVAAPDEVLTFTLTLQTRPIGKNETLDIVNRATLFGADTVPDYWDEDESMATSFGNEVGVQKRVWSQTEAVWVRSMRVPTSPDGSLADKRYVYQIDFRSYDGFTDNALIDVVDSLSSSVDFLSFVPTGDPVDGLAMQPADYVDTMSIATLTAEYNASPVHEVRVTKPQGEWYPAGARISFLLLVEVNDDSSQIANSLSWNGGKVPGTDTNIEGVSHPSIDIEKWIDEGSEPMYDADGNLLNDKFTGDHDAAPGKKLTAGKTETINFTVSNNGGDRLVDISVEDSLISGHGQITDLSCVFPDSTGTFWRGPMEIGTQFACSGTLPKLQPGQSHANTATVTAWGEINRDVEVTDKDDWHGNVPAPGLVNTGGQALTGLALFGGVGILAGVLLMLRKRKATA